MIQAHKGKEIEPSRRDFIKRDQKCLLGVCEAPGWIPIKGGNFGKEITTPW